MAMRRPGPYVPLSAHYADDEKVIEAGEAAELLYVRMLAYAARTPSTEGWISDAVLRSRLGILPYVSGNGAGTDAGTVPGTDVASRAEKLREVGLITKEGKGWRIDAWLRWNRSADEVSRERTRDRYRKKRPTSTDDGTRAGTDAGNDTGTGDGTPGAFPPSDTDTDTDTDTDRERGPAKAPDRPATEKTHAAPTAQPPPDGTKQAPPRRRGAPLPDDFAVTDDMRAWAATRNGHIDIDTETEKFINHWRAKPGKDGLKLDWTATWRNWILRVVDYAPARTSRPYDRDPWAHIPLT